jgi:FKBP-type peptidyl-prolyl cis-trans isomerase FkpA
MQVGGKARLTCPAKLAYQDRGVGKIPPGAAITFEVELIKIIE